MQEGGSRANARKPEDYISYQARNEGGLNSVTHNGISGKGEHENY